MRAPSFAGLKPASNAASLAKRMNRSADTIHEKLLRGVLWRRGLRFRKNLKDLPGKPDIVFASARVVVFCDERTTVLLNELGWYVIRLWEGDIRANPENAALVVEEAVTTRRMEFLGQQCAS